MWTISLEICFRGFQGCTTSSSWAETLIKLAVPTSLMSLGWNEPIWRQILTKPAEKSQKKRNNNVDVYKDYSTNKRAQFYGPTNSTELRNESRKVGRFSWFEQEMNSTLEHCEKKSSSSSAAASSSSSSKIEWGVNQRAWFVVFLLFLGRQVEFRVSASKLFSVETGR